MDSRAPGETSGRREENKKNKTRADNLKKYKMIRSGKILRYEEDLSSQEKKFIQTEVARYRSSHIGYKIVEAYLVPSARENNSEANKNKIVRYVNNRGYRVAEVKERGFAKLELKFKDYKEANKCLDDDETREIVLLACVKLTPQH